MYVSCAVVGLYERGCQAVPGAWITANRSQVPYLIHIKLQVSRFCRGCAQAPPTHALPQTAAPNVSEFRYINGEDDGHSLGFPGIVILTGTWNDRSYPAN